MSKVHPHCARGKCSQGAVLLSLDERFDHLEDWAGMSTCDQCPFDFQWLRIVGLKDTHVQLSAARWMWLWVQETIISVMAASGATKRLRPMPGDPQPEFWKKPTKPRQPQVGGTIFERLKSAYRVEDIAGTLTDLRGMGNVMKGRCPLHNEQTGEAFAVYVDTQTWKCFGKCGIGGDVIALVEACIERGIDWRMTH